MQQCHVTWCTALPTRSLYFPNALDARLSGGTYNGRNEARKMFESPCWKKAEAKLWMKAEMKFFSWKMAEINLRSNVYDYHTHNSVFVLSMSYPGFFSTLFRQVHTT